MRFDFSTPAPQGMYVGPSARASKMLAVELKSATTAFGGKGVGAIPQVSFTMKVKIVLRTLQQLDCA